MKPRLVFPVLIAVALAVAIIGSDAVSPTPAEAATIIGADLGGGDLIVSDGDVLSGTFTNVGTFTIPAGVTVFVDPAIPLSITADTIIIDGTLDGSGAGSLGGAPVPNIPSCVPHNTVTGNAGSGTGGGGGGLFGCNIHGGGGGGGGYGGAGGVSSSVFGSFPDPTPGGVVFGDATSPSINLGSGGGSGSAYNQEELSGFSGAGGAGGAAISMFGAIDLNGTILADGADGGLPTDENGAGGGGGSGGGVLLDGKLFLDGLISVTGGDGVAGTFGFPSSGGGGGGGRIKLFGSASVQAGFSVDVTGGGVGESTLVEDGTEATAGQVGTSLEPPPPQPTPTPTPTATPTVTPTPVPPVGGIGVFPDGGDSSGGSVAVITGFAAIIATAIALAGAAWYARRRWAR